MRRHTNDSIRRLLIKRGFEEQTRFHRPVNLGDGALLTHWHRPGSIFIELEEYADRPPRLFEVAGLRTAIEPDDIPVVPNE